MLEEKSPGTKHQMYFGFLKKAADKFAATEGDAVEVVPCAECGAPTVTWDGGEARCSFCKTKALAHKRRQKGGGRRRARAREKKA